MVFNESSFTRILFVMTVMAPLWGARCVPQGGEPPPSDTISRVLFIAQENLAGPAFGPPQVFMQAARSSIDPDDPQAGMVVGFFLTIAVNRPDDLMLRLRDSVEGKEVPLERLLPTSVELNSPPALAPQPLNQVAVDLLESGRGVFWFDQGPLASGGLEHRLAVLLPNALLGSPVRLMFFTAQAADGTPIGGDSIELVGGFFQMAAIGDSIVWGNGLNESDKFTTLVADVIESETRLRVISQVLAQTGAALVANEHDGVCEVNCSGETPTVSVSVTAQVDLLRAPEQLDLILVNGCLVDVGLNLILIDEIPGEELVEQTRRFCGDEMSTLLERLREVAPNARIVVMSNYPIVSPQSDLFGLEQWAATRGQPLGQGAITFKENSAARSELFDQISRESLAAAVEAVNASSPGEAVVALANPGWGPENSVFAPESWQWNLTSNRELEEFLDIGVELFPEDPRFEFRLDVCGSGRVISDLITCLFASVGHPNTLGAQAYAEAIIVELRELGVLENQIPDP